MCSHVTAKEKDSGRLPYAGPAAVCGPGCRMRARLPCAGPAAVCGPGCRVRARLPCAGPLKLPDTSGPVFECMHGMIRR